MKQKYSNIIHIESVVSAVETVAAPYRHLCLCSRNCSSTLQAPVIVWRLDFDTDSNIIHIESVVSAVETVAAPYRHLLLSGG